MKLEPKELYLTLANTYYVDPIIVQYLGEHHFNDEVQLYTFLFPNNCRMYLNQWAVDHFILRKANMLDKVIYG